MNIWYGMYVCSRHIHHHHLLHLWLHVRELAQIVKDSAEYRCRLSIRAHGTFERVPFVGQHALPRHMRRAQSLDHDGGLATHVDVS